MHPFYVFENGVSLPGVSSEFVCFMFCLDSFVRRLLKGYFSISNDF